MGEEKISAEFPFKGKYQTVVGAKIHYVDEGSGDPLLFLHGVPTCSYLWRNIIPVLSKNTRCIAPDLIGMGKSDKPDIAYTIFEHIQYIDEFIKALDLRNITLVLHGWGSVIGFNYAVKHPDNIKGVAFYESYIGPAADEHQLALPIQHLRAELQKHEKKLEEFVGQTGFVEQVLKAASLRKLSAEELQNYLAPFSKAADCKPIVQFLLDSPLFLGGSDVAKLIDHYSHQLETLGFPKLLFYSIPGFMTPITNVQWCRDHLPNLNLIDLGEAMHLAQEFNPQKFSAELLGWYKQIT